MTVKPKYKEISTILRISDDGLCINEGCNNKIKKDSKGYCDECKKKRAEYFRQEYKRKMGWD